MFWNGSGTPISSFQNRWWCSLLLRSKIHTRWTPGLATHDEAEITILNQARKKNTSLTVKQVWQPLVFLEPSYLSQRVRKKLSSLCLKRLARLEVNVSSNTLHGFLQGTTNFIIIFAINRNIFRFETLLVFVWYFIWCIRTSRWSGKLAIVWAFVFRCNWHF